MFCTRPVANIETNTDYLFVKFNGHRNKTIIEDFVCFQQACTAYLKYCKSHNV